MYFDSFNFRNDLFSKIKSVSNAQFLINCNSLYSQNTTIKIPLSMLIFGQRNSITELILMRIESIIWYYITFSTKNVQLFHLFLTDSLLFTRTMSRSRKETCWAHFNSKRKLKFLFLPKISFWAARPVLKNQLWIMSYFWALFFQVFMGKN